MSAARFVVTGRVQGVFFRASTEKAARGLALTGRVWNRDDGAVELVAEGPLDSLAELESWLHRGPPAARVERVTREPLERAARYSDFRTAGRPAE